MADFVSTDGGRDAEGFRHETNDCVVRAWAIAAQIPYAEAHAAFKAAGRRDRRGTKLHVSEAVMGDLRCYPRGSRVTVAKWLRANPSGHFVVFVRGHAFAVIDGVCHDYYYRAAMRPRCIVLYVRRAPPPRATTGPKFAIEIALDALRGVTA